VLLIPSAIATLSLWWHNWNTNSSSSTTCTTNLVQGTYPTSCMSPDNLCKSAWIQQSGSGLDPLLQTYAPHCSLQSRCDPAISSHLFPISNLTFPQRCQLPGAAPTCALVGGSIPDRGTSVEEHRSACNGRKTLQYPGSWQGWLETVTLESRSGSGSRFSYCLVGGFCNANTQFIGHKIDIYIVKYLISF